MFVVTLSPSADSASYARKAKKAGADFLEIRTDLTPTVKIARSTLPFLLAVRGRSPFSVQGQYAFVDVENMEDLRRVPVAQRNNAKIILSFHDYRRVPSRTILRKRIQAMLCTPGVNMVKIACTVSSYEELKTLLTLQQEFVAERKRLIILGMGPKAHLTRVLSPLRNPLTYASLDGQQPSADGQLPLSFYRLLKGRKKPKLFGIIGGPQILHSKSPSIHNALFQRHNVDALYSLFPSDHFRKTIKILRSLDVTGLSVTAPFKHEAYAVTTEQHAPLQILKAANTLRFQSGKIRAWNSDWVGIRDGYPVLRGKKSVAILGAGGAVPSAILALRNLTPNADITVFARDTKKAQASLHRFGVSVLPLRKASDTCADAVLCCISEDRKLPLPQIKSTSSVAIDLRYGKDTAFMKAARRRGFRVFDGVPMLIHQALLQFHAFSQKRATQGDVRLLSSMMKAVSSSS